MEWPQGFWGFTLLLCQAVLASHFPFPLSIFPYSLFWHLKLKHLYNCCGCLSLSQCSKCRILLTCQHFRYPAKIRGVKICPSNSQIQSFSLIRILIPPQSYSGSKSRILRGHMRVLDLQLFIPTFTSFLYEKSDESEGDELCCEGCPCGTILFP